MSRGTKVVPDFIPAGGHEPNDGDYADERLSAVDIGQDFTTAPDSVLPLADVNEQ